MEERGRSDCDPQKAAEVERFHTLTLKKSLLIGDFFQFMSIKRATVNEARPASAPNHREPPT
jgi:hypothetical protein